MFKPILLIVLALPSWAWGSLSCPTDLPITQRDLVGLEKYVEIQKFSSIECFVSGLPRDVRAFRTYLKTSLSMQAASPTHPRALVGSPDGGFFLTFNGHPSQKGYEEVEFLALDKNEGPTKWVAGSILKENGVLRIKKDIQKCSSCHGNPIRPIWGTYPSWHNAFGSVDDFLPDPKDPGKGSPYYPDHEKSLFEEDRVTEDFYGDGYQSGQPRLTDELLATAIKESEQFREFREKAKEDPRYGPLEEASDSSSPVYPYSENYRTRNIAFRPNLYIGSMMALRQNEILQNTLKNNPAYSKFKSLTFVYNHCRPEEVSDGFYNQIYEFIAGNYKRVYGREMPVEFNKDTQSYSLQSDHFVDIFGIKPHQKTFLFADNIDYLGEMERSYSGGYASLLSSALSNLLEDHLRTWSDSEKFVSDYQSEYLTDEGLKERIEQFPFMSFFQSEFLGAEIYNKLQYSYGGQQILANNNEYATDEQKELQKEMCSRLEEESKPILGEAELTGGDWFKKEVVSSNSWPVSINSCVECHDSGENSVGPIIPFKDQKALAEFNKTYFSNFGWGDFSDAVFLMTLESITPAHHGGLRMPLGRAPLNPHEVQEILDWIQGR